MEDIKFTLTLVSFMRPRMMKFALKSILEQDYPKENIHLFFIDDGSEPSTIPVCKEFMGDWIGKFVKKEDPPEERVEVERYEHATFYRISDTPEDKTRQGGTRHPGGMNYSVLNTPGMEDHDVVQILCDDDAITCHYLSSLNEYYKANPNVGYSYSHLISYNPLTELPDPAFAERGFWLNHGVDVASAYCKCDSSQVSYRKAYFSIYGVRYPNPHGRALDATLYGQLQTFDICRFNGITGAFKGDFPNQLSYRVAEEDIYNPIDTEMI